MPAPWVETEMRGVDLKDRRLNDRLREVVSQFAAQPAAGLPASCGGHAEMTAAYRLCDNPKVSFEAVLSPHQAATRLRIAAQPEVVLAQDTTECDLTRPESEVAGAGPLDEGARQGALLHEVLALTPDGTPLGTVGACVWSRPNPPPDPSSKTRARRAAIPITEKESYRWVMAFRLANATAQACPATHVVLVADSESDIYEVFEEAQNRPANLDWIIRAAQDRAMAPDDEPGDGPRTVRERLAQEPELFRTTVQVRARRPRLPGDRRRRRQFRESREAVVSVRAATVILRPPWRPAGRPPAVEVNVVLAREINPPAGDEPVEWLLLTSLPIATAAQVRQVLAFYRVRWMVEIFFRVLKSGCRVEERRFERLERWTVCLAVYLIVAWRTLYVTRVSRLTPSRPCDEVFTAAEWQALWVLIRKQALPAEAPTLEIIVRLVAQLGGYVNRKRPDPPGPQTIWLGLQRLHDIAACWQTFGPGALNRDKDV